MEGRIPLEKVCPSCGEVKSAREFLIFKQGQYTEGGATVRKRVFHCRKCRARSTARMWRRNNPGRKKKQNQEYWKTKSKHNKKNTQKLLGESDESES